jgi:hypothetical protein
MSCEVIKSSNTPWNTIHALEGSDKDINSLYRLMKDRISKFERDDPVYCNDILSTATIAFRPLRIDELVGIVDLPPEIIPEVIITKMCAPFLEISNGTVYFRHQTARDFLMMDMKPNQQVSRKIAWMIERCLKNVLTVSVNDDEPISVSYVTTFWLEHLSNLDLDDSDLDKEAKLLVVEIVRDAMVSVNAFLSDPSSLGHWFDILTKQRLLPQALAKMRTLEVSLKRKVFPPAMFS